MCFSDNSFNCNACKPIVFDYWSSLLISPPLSCQDLVQIRSVTEAYFPSNNDGIAHLKHFSNETNKSASHCNYTSDPKQYWVSSKHVSMWQFWSDLSLSWSVTLSVVSRQWPGCNWQIPSYLCLLAISPSHCLSHSANLFVSTVQALIGPIIKIVSQLQSHG